MLIVRLSLKLEARLNNLAKQTGRPKAHYIEQAIVEFLDEQEDYLIALVRLKDALPSVALRKVAKRLV